MPSGGARVRSGPAPDPNALRRERDADDWVVLSPDGRVGRPPAWPLPTKASATELAFWRKLWKLPQAIEWERNQTFIEVGLYVRRVLEAQEHDSPAALSTLARQMGDSLGLTTVGMRANRWKIERTPVEAEEAKPEGERASARDRFRVVNGDG